MLKKLKTKFNTFPMIVIFFAFFFSFPKNIQAANKTVKEEDSENANANVSIGKPGPINYETRIIDGKPACAKDNDRPGNSNKNRPGHIDGECCLDPDETPNSNCYYPPGKYGDMLEEYQNRHGD